MKNCTQEFTQAPYSARDGVGGSIRCMQLCVSWLLCSSSAGSVGVSGRSQMVFITNPENEKGPACEIIGFFFAYFLWVKLMFMSWVVLHLFCFSVFYKDLQNLEILFVCVSVLFPLLFLWAPFISGKEYGGVPVYGSAGAWCWIKNWRNDCVDDKFKNRNW